VVATLAGTSSLLRLKSMMRYWRLWPPPMWRVVIRPVLERPPVRFLLAINERSGVSVVISSKPNLDMPR
jgi:hypothetical protein